MFLQEPYNELQNQAYQPIIYKQKLIQVEIVNGKVGTNYYFPKDEEIDNSIIKGIRFQPCTELAGLPSTVSMVAPGKLFAGFNVARFIKVNLLNKNNSFIIKDRPLYSFAGVRTTNLAFLLLNSTAKVTPRMNFQIMLKKCSISVTSNVFGVSTFVVVFSIDYLPLR